MLRSELKRSAFAERDVAIGAHEGPRLGPAEKREVERSRTKLRDWADPQAATHLSQGAALITMQSLIAYGRSMASITIRKLDEQTKARLRVRAAHRNRSMEDEARHILRMALAEDAATPRNLATSIQRRFQPLGGVELRLPAREPTREPPTPGKRVRR